MNVVFAAAIGIPLLTGPSPAVRETVTSIVHKIQRADYEGDRPALRRLHGELAPFVHDPALGSRVQYWRGFAMWRKALNGFNDSADRAELADDLKQCVDDFRDALAQDPTFADAKGGAASCLVNHSLLLMESDFARARELFSHSVSLLQDAIAEAPENARLLWVQGANERTE